MIYGPLKNTTDKERTGSKRALPLSYPGIWLAGRSQANQHSPPSLKLWRAAFTSYDCSWRRLEPEAGLEPATSRLWSDNPILRPVENACLKGRARDDLDIPDGTRTRVLPFAWNALALLSYRFDNRSATARPKELTGKEGAGNPAILAAGAGFEPARDFSLNR